MARLPPIVSLRSPLEESSAAVVDHIRAGVGSSTTTSPSPKKVASSGLSMVAHAHHEELDLGEDLLTSPHPTRSGKALFVMDDMAERAM